MMLKKFKQGKTSKCKKSKTPSNREVPFQFLRPVYAIDPGPKTSAFVEYVPMTNTVKTHKILDNHSLALDLLRSFCTATDTLVIEMVSCMGQVAGESLFETCFWIGRFVEIWRGKTFRIRRVSVKHHLTGRTGAKDSHVRQTVIDRFSGHLDLGGGKTPAIGLASNQGPLYQVSRDEWQALALAITFCEVGPDSEMVWPTKKIPR